MVFFPGYGIILIITICHVTSGKHGQRKVESESEHAFSTNQEEFGDSISSSDAMDEKDANYNIRKRRSLKMMLEGIEALRKLLAGTRRVRSQSMRYRKYEKEGDIDTAYNDFFSVRPTTVTEMNYKGTTRFHGIVGDREIRLRDPRKTGADIIIDLVDPKTKRALMPGEPKTAAQFIDRITYTKKRQ